MTKEQDFKNRLITVLQDLKDSGVKDKEAVWLLGSLASDLIDDLKVPDWSTAKRDMDAQTYDALLQTFGDKGNEHHQAGRTKQAYAIQAMAVSLVARSQRADPQVAAGESLLDEIINHAAAAYRRQKPN